MALEDLRDELSDEIASIFDSQFTISITATNTVPQPDDPAITFPNLDTRTQGAKLITTCVLYIDMRKSTDLSLAHKQQTVAKLYSAFVRAMTRTARHYGGHVRGIIGDRVMVLFDVENCFANAVHCAIAMNTVAQFIINKHFKANEVLFGIGIDHGRMLVTKAGIRRHGSEQGNYRNLVWLGRPANVASKLTDVANKPAEFQTVPTVRVAYETRKQPELSSFGSLMLGLGGAATAEPKFGGGLSFGALYRATESPFSTLNTTSSDATPQEKVGRALSLGALYGATDSPSSTINTTSSDGWTWVTETPSAFLSQLEVNYSPSKISHKHPDFGSFFVWEEEVATRADTPAILMTAAVWNGYKKAMPESVSVKEALFKNVDVTVPGYTDTIYGGRVIYPQLKPK